MGSTPAPSGTCQDCGKVTTRPVKSCPEGGTGKKRCGGSLVITREPYIQSQIMVDKIDEEKKDLHFDVACDILDKIQNEKFDQDREACFQWGRKCPYYNYCRSTPENRDTEGLLKA